MPMNLTSPRSPSHRLAAFTLAAAALAAPAAADSSVAPALRAALARAESTGEVEAATRDLVALGAPLIESGLAVLVTGREPDRGGQAGAALSASGRQALEAALSFLPAAAVGAGLERCVDAAPTETEAARLFELVGLLGRPQELELFYELGELVARDGAPERATAQAFRSGLTALLVNHPETHPRLAGSWINVVDELRSALVQAIADADHPDGLRTLLGMLGWDSDLTSQLLSALAGQCRHASPELRRTAAGQVTPLLGDADEGVRTAAAHTIGMLGLPDSAIALVDLLGDESHSVRRNAYDALRAVTGLSFSAEGPAWRAWLNLETQWWRKNSGRLARDLASKKSSTTLAMIEEFAGHPVFCDRIAPAFVEALGDARPRVRERLCAALARLEWGVAAPRLRELLDDRDAAVRAAAQRALEALVPEDALELEVALGDR
jgi:hypothetical protein